MKSMGKWTLTGAATVLALLMAQAVAAVPEQVATVVALVIKPRTTETMGCPPGGVFDRLQA